MRIFYDCEFLEDGKTIDLISIGLIAEAGDEYYAVNSDMPIERIESHGWLMKNVVPHIPGQFAREILRRQQESERAFHPGPRPTPSSSRIGSSQTRFATSFWASQTQLWARTP